MSTIKVFFISTFVKKAASTAVAFLLLLNCLSFNAASLKLFSGEFDMSEIASAQQKAFNVSAYINKAADSICKIFNSRAAAITSDTALVEEKSVPQNGVPADSKGGAVLYSGNTVLSVSQQSHTHNLSYFDFNRTYIDPGGGGIGFRPDLLFVASYFLIMLLFFASSRKVFVGVFDHLNTKTPA